MFYAFWMQNKLDKKKLLLRFSAGLIIQNDAVVPSGTSIFCYSIYNFANRCWPVGAGLLLKCCMRLDPGLALHLSSIHLNGVEIHY